MAKISKGIPDNSMRAAMFNLIHAADITELRRISNQSYGAVFTDENGVERMVELRTVLRDVRDDMTGSEQLEDEATKYADKVREAEENAAKRAAEKAAKIERDKARRAKVKKDTEKMKQDIAAELAQ